jgi:hypothetical protein
MSDHVVTVRLSLSQAEFLQANLSLLAANTRQAMTRPGLEAERHMALGCRAIVLENTEDAIRSAMVEMPDRNRTGARDGEVVSRRQPRRHAQISDGSAAHLMARSAFLGG